jgi:branched-chain amino acid transport system permease protein
MAPGGTSVASRTVWVRPLAAMALAAVLLSAPLWLGRYPVYLLNLVGIFALVGIGLNLLTGFAGQISLGHAAFFGIGAYATGLLTGTLGVPFLLSLLAAGLLTTAIGALVALPALRLQNLYLAIATLGFGVVVQKTLFEWRGLTGGGSGLTLTPAKIGPIVLADEVSLYYVVLAIAALGAWTAANIARSRTGRALIMLRESEIAAGALGINIARHKVIAFALSAFYTAVAGGLYAYLVRYINPESFNLSLSIAFLSTIVIGGLGTIPGSILGAVFYVLVPELFRGFKDAPGLVFGLSLVLVMVFMPRGLWGLVSLRARR